MKHRRFVVASTVIMIVIGAAVAGLSWYSTVVKASIPGLPEAVAYFPPDSEAIFGMNVQKFIHSPLYGKVEEQHGRKIGEDLAEFIAKTGVDPRSDIHYVVAAGSTGDAQKGKGVVIAVGNFNPAAITTFIRSQAVPIELDYKGTTVLMVPEGEGGNKVDKGLAFLSSGEIAMGELECLKKVLDIRADKTAGILDNPTLGPLLRSLNPEEMFWFAGDAANILAKAPTNTPLGTSISAIQNVVGTLNLSEFVSGDITVTARDEESAQKLADVVRGLVALGQLAGEQNPVFVELMQGVSISHAKEKINLKVNFSIELIEKLEHAKPAAAARKAV